MTNAKSSAGNMPTAPTSSLAPELGPTDRVRFIASHRPKLEDGDYEITVTSKLTVSRQVGTITEEHTYVSGAHGAFTVAGPRVSINPSLVHSSFPPARSRGRFGHALPHIVLNRTTLPWERSAALEKPLGSGESPPWLAVITFDSADLNGRKKNLTVADLHRPRTSSTPKSPPFPTEIADDPTECVHVIELPWSTLQPALPTAAEMPWVAHVRDVIGPAPSHITTNESADEPVAITETATVIGTSCPVMGKRNEAHLVSLEGWFQFRGDQLEPAFQVDDNDVVRLVSLYSWDFFCENDEPRGFTDLADSLGDGVGMLAAPRPSGLAGPYIANGYAALRHEFRHGECSISWYHGPLRPGPGDMAISQRTLPRIPAKASDDLLRFDADAQIFDASYAAAWELGRLLAIADPSVGLPINRWRTARRHRSHRNRQMQQHRDLSHGITARAEPRLDVTDWVVRSLDRLAAVPFRYLVPDEAMLPIESLRFFEVDHQWIQCLRDGAFSLGRTDDDEGWQVDEIELLATMLPPIPEMSGVLLRSDIVSHYPGLMIDAFADAQSADEWTDLDKLVPVPPLRIAHLSPRVVLALYEGPVHAVALHLHPQVMHFELADRGRTSHSTGDFNRLEEAIRLLTPSHSGELARQLLGHTPRRTYRRSS
jgi:hypothetical protein